MRLCRFLILFSCLSAVLSSVIIGQPQSKDHHFRSSFGFELDYPRNWTANVMGHVPPLAAKDLDPGLLQDPVKRGIACSQKIFFSRTGEPPSYFIAGVETAECAGRTPTLEAYSSRMESTVRNSYDLKAIKTGFYFVNGQRFWILDATGEKRRASIGSATIEYVATVIPQGLLYCSIEAANDTAKADFEHTLLHLDGGTETELVPDAARSALAAQSATRPPQNPSLSAGKVVSAESPASHHFESGLGFTYNVPQGLEILDAKRADAGARAKAQKLDPTRGEAKSIECGKVVLAAEAPDHSRIVVISIHYQSCIGYPLTAEHFPEIASSGIFEVNKLFRLSNVERGQAAIGTHPILLVRSTISPVNSSNPNRFMALMIAPIQDGMAEFMIQAQTSEDLEKLMATHIKFDDGSEGELVPQSAFPSK